MKGGENKGSRLTSLKRLRPGTSVLATVKAKAKPTAVAEIVESSAMTKELNAVFMYLSLDKMAAKSSGLGYTNTWSMGYATNTARLATIRNIAAANEASRTGRFIVYPSDWKLGNSRGQTPGIAL